MIVAPDIYFVLKRRTVHIVIRNHLLKQNNYLSCNSILFILQHKISVQVQKHTKYKRGNMSRSLPLIIVLVVIVVNVDSLTNLKEKFKWKQIEFEWPSEDVKKAWISSKKYIPENNLPLGLEKWNNKLFVTIPRWKPGVAAALNYVNLDDTNDSPKFKPYPSWDDNDFDLPSNGSGLGVRKDSNVISPFRVRADECDRLWVQDSGAADIFGDYDQVAPASVVIFDLKTDKVLRRFTIPEELTKEATFIANVVSKFWPIYGIF